MPPATEWITPQQWMSCAKRAERANYKREGTSLTYTSISNNCRAYIIEVRENILVVKPGWRQAMKAVRPMTKLRATINHLQQCQQARAAGHPVSYTTDPAWLVNMAINRRAGWPDDPSLSRGSCMPMGGQYPKKASGDSYNHLRLIAREVNTPRLRVYVSRLGEWRKLLLARLPERFVTYEEE